MPIRFMCNECGKSFTVADHNAGKKARCPCGASLRVPQSASLSENMDVQPPKTETKTSSQIKQGDADAEKHSTAFRANDERSKTYTALSVPNLPKQSPPPMPHTLPWKRGRDYLVGTGEMLEEALSEELGAKVKVLAFESGVSPSISPLRLACKAAIGVLCMPLILLMAAILIIPSWVYFTRLAIQDSKSAEQFGIKGARIMLGLLLLYGFGIWSGFIMALQIVGIFMRPAPIILARTSDLYIVARLSPWMLFLPRISSIDTFPVNTASLKVVSLCRSKMVTALHTPDTDETIETRAQCAISGLSPTELSTNRKLLLTGVYSDTEAEESPKSYVAAYLLNIFLGGFGADKFYLGYYIQGIIKLLTLGGLGCWVFIDIILPMVKDVFDSQGRIVVEPEGFVHTNSGMAGTPRITG